MGVKLFESCEFPSLRKWFENFKQISVIEENLPSQGEMDGLFE